ncbi:hypothetical protein [Halovivax cerinus]|uniref:Uncharacterized protein n=1 Tax=Halovivax cerinus TaxID=1487865 RepID=A0ABD5NKH0_9EURY|nr:hypothetical protein [Halovivax cerinus]
MTDQERTTITVNRGTFEKVKSLKRGGECWDDLLEQMANSYHPDEFHNRTHDT